MLGHTQTPSKGMQVRIVHVFIARECTFPHNVTLLLTIRNTWNILRSRICVLIVWPVIRWLSALPNIIVKSVNANTTPVSVEQNLVTQLKLAKHQQHYRPTQHNPPKLTPRILKKTPTTVTASITPPEPVIKVPAKPPCLLKTAVAQVNVDGVQAEANILFDEGAQQLFMPEKLAKTLKISLRFTESVNISAFGAELPSTKWLGVTTVNIEALTGEQIPLSILVVPVIAAPLHNVYHHHLRYMSYLQGLRLANPVTRTGITVNWCRLLLAICGLSHSLW